MRNKTLLNPVRAERVFPIVLSLSKGAWVARHQSFDKLRPFDQLRTNGGQKRFSANAVGRQGPGMLFNASLDGNVRRAIDLHEGDDIDASAFLALLRQTVAVNVSDLSIRSKRKKKPPS